MPIKLKEKTIKRINLITKPVKRVFKGTNLVWAIYNITYNVGNGTVNKNPDVYVWGTSENLPTPTFSGATFGGWYTDKNYINKKTQITEQDQGDINFYAKWTKQKTQYKITYQVTTGGGSTDMSVIGDYIYNLRGQNFNNLPDFNAAGVGVENCCAKLVWYVLWKCGLTSYGDGRSYQWTANAFKVRVYEGTMSGYNNGPSTSGNTGNKGDIVCFLQSGYNVNSMEPYHGAHIGICYGDGTYIGTGYDSSGGPTILKRSVENELNVTHRGSRWINYTITTLNLGGGSAPVTTTYTTDWQDNTNIPEGTEISRQTRTVYCDWDYNTNAWSNTWHE